MPNSAKNTKHIKLLCFTYNIHIYFNMISGNSVMSQINCSKGKKGGPGSSV